MLVTEQATSEAAEARRTRRLILVIGRGWHPGRDRHRRQPDEGTLRPARRSSSPRSEDGTGKGSGRSISRRRPRRRRARRQGQWPAHRRRRPRHGRRADARAGRDRAVARLPQRAAGGRCRGGARRPRAVARRPARAGRSRRGRCATRSMLPGLMAPAGPPRASPPDPARLLEAGIVGNGHVRGDRLRRRRQLVQADRLPRRRDRAWPGAAFVARPTSAGGWPERSSATNGTAAMRRKCIWRTPRPLDPPHASPSAPPHHDVAPSSSG